LCKLNEGMRNPEKGTTLPPRDDRLHAQLAKAYLSSGRRTDAEKALAKSKEFRDYQRQATGLLLQCSESLKARDFNKALEIYARLQQTEDVDDLISLGINFGQSELYEQAIKLLTRAVQLSPNSYEAHYNLGLMFLRTKRQDEAEENLSRTVALHPYSFEAPSLLRVVLSHKCQTDAAVMLLQRAATLIRHD